jgi:hypothetical protein
MAFELTVKNTFIDFDNDDVEEMCVRPAKTCPAEVNRFRDESDTEDEQPGRQPRVQTWAAGSDSFSDASSNTFSDDSDEEEREEHMFPVKTLNDFSPHSARHAIQCNNDEDDTAVVDPPVQPCVPREDKQCVCGNVIKPNANFCCNCGKQCCQTGGRPPMLPLLLPVMPVVSPVMPEVIPEVEAQPSTVEPPSARQPVRLSELVEVDVSNGGSAAVGAHAADVVPLAQRQPEWSRGACLHIAGMCKPCGWFWKPQGCANGQDCCHCHLCPSTAFKTRRKAKRATY